MKPLSELVKELSENVAAHGCEVCGECHVEQTFTEELQAWLREADSAEPPKWFDYELLSLFRDNEYLFKKGGSLWQAVRQNLLGTTRTEGKK